MKSQRYKIGSLLLIPLGDQKFAFGRIINKEEIAFYNYLSSNRDNINFAEIYSSDILFRLPVMRYAVTSNRWLVVDVKPVEKNLTIPNKYFIQDTFTKEFSIYHIGEIFPATYEQIIGLERAAVWEPEHIEDRLRDYFNGIENTNVQQLKPQIT
jgi:hypothetical protein